MEKTAWGGGGGQTSNDDGRVVGDWVEVGTVDFVVVESALVGEIGFRGGGGTNDGGGGITNCEVEAIEWCLGGGGTIV